MSIYNLLIDGAARKNHGAAGIGVVIMDEQGKTVAEWSKYLGIATHNAADYEALIDALETAVKKRYKKVFVHTDSTLLARQVTGRYRVRNQHLKALAEKVKSLADRFNHFEINFITRQDNEKARQLAKQAICSVPPEEMPGAALVAETALPAKTPNGDEQEGPADSIVMPIPSPSEETVGGPVPEAQIAAEAVEGVTWRVLAFTSNIMLVQFNYKKGARIPVHRHINEQACYLIKGRVKYTLADKEVILTPGLGIVIQGNSDHGLEAQADSIEITTYAPMRGDLFRK